MNRTLELTINFTIKEMRTVVSILEGALDEARPKLAAYLLRLAEKQGRVSGDEAMIELPFPRADVPPTAGIPRDHFELLMEELGRAGIVVGPARSLHILSIAKLRATASVGADLCVRPPDGTNT